MLLSNSPWPFIISINLINFLIRMIFFFRGHTNLLFLRTIILILNSMIWFKDLNSEYNINGESSLNLENTIKFFFILFILSEIIVFVSIFWSYYCFFLVRELDISIWPGYSIKTFEWNIIPMVNTLILISSSITLTVSHWCINFNIKKFINLFLFITILLGITFTYLQFEEYNSSFYSLNDGRFGSIFFLLTGLHGAHVIIGTLILISCFLKTNRIDSIISNSERFEIGSWYWHFVDLVWIFVLYSLYYLN